ncbi:MAG TPA: alpha/beta hydrolase [Acidimicrobiales bacterium]|nr:alpha/beta hydrolase [Acidimicrobiales bacterium]
MTASDPIGPDWFRDALAAAVATEVLEVDGCTIACRWWGDRDDPAVVLVHGGGAHARWWDHVGPLLADGRGVVAFDMSGHGDSGRRDRYTFDHWAEEVLAVCARSSHPERPVVVAHSMGGQAAVKAILGDPDAAKAVVLVDTAIRQLEPEQAAALAGNAFGPLKHYATVEEALARFHTIPDQPTSLPYVLDHVARTSVRPTGDGWTWKFDPGFLTAIDRPDPAALADVRCRFALLRAQFGLISSDMDDLFRLHLAADRVLVDIPEAWHHVMLDQPLSLVTALRTLLATWRHGGRP